LTVQRPTHEAVADGREVATVNEYQAAQLGDAADTSGGHATAV
jgi:hypothetical protein